MNNTFHGALVFLVILCLCPASYGQSDSKDAQDAELRFSIQMTSALNNDPKAQFQIAEMYEQGTGTPQNLRMAHLWYTKSANQKYAPAIKKLASWGSEKQQTEAARERAEEQKRRQAEAEATATAKAARERAEEQKRRQAEAEATATAKAARERAEEQKRRQAEAAGATTTAVKAAQAAETVPTAKEKQSETNRPKDKSKGAAEKSAEKGVVEFKANPCNTPTAKFTSTCQ
jgi:colicin import membrane protein